MHHPVRLLRLPLPPVVRVEHEDLFVAPQVAGGGDRSGFSGLVPSGLAAVFVGVHFPAFPRAGGVGFRGSVEKMTYLPFLAYACRENSSVDRLRAVSR